MTKTYTITLEVESESDPNNWYYGPTFVIDEPYRIKKVEESKSE